MAAPTTTSGAEPEVNAVQLVRLNLKYEFVTNNVKIGPGTVEVSEDVAEDLLRREAEYDTIERERLMSKEIIVDVSKATGTVFSGAGVDVSAL